MAESPERRTKLNTDAGSSPQCGESFFSPGPFSVQTLSLSLSYGARAAPVYSGSDGHMCCAHVTNDTYRQPHRCWDPRLLNGPVGIGSAALAAAVALLRYDDPNLPQGIPKY